MDFAQVSGNMYVKCNRGKYFFKIDDDDAAYRLLETKSGVIVNAESLPMTKDQKKVLVELEPRADTDLYFFRKFFIGEGGEGKSSVTIDSSKMKVVHQTGTRYIVKDLSEDATRVFSCDTQGKCYFSAIEVHDTKSTLTVTVQKMNHPQILSGCHFEGGTYTGGLVYGRPSRGLFAKIDHLGYVGALNAGDESNVEYKLEKEEWVNQGSTKIEIHKV